MKSEELMIGDWVYQSYVNKNIRWSPRDFFMHINGHITDRLIIGRDIEPIPLTPEILEKNGFVIEEREGDPTFPYLAFIIENDEYRVEITWYDSHDVYEPNTGEYLHGAPEVWNMEILGKCGNYDCGKNKLYVHELQHALKLCGIDKIIEL